MGEASKIEWLSPIWIGAGDRAAAISAASSVPTNVLVADLSIDEVGAGPAMKVTE